MIYDITPCPKPRQTRSDKWKKRPAVMRYRAFADECRLKKVTFVDGDKIIFYIAMPKSWSKKKKDEMFLQSHKQKPDIDNLFKALADAIYKEDSHISEITIMKCWGKKGAIQII